MNKLIPHDGHDTIGLVIAYIGIIILSLAFCGGFR